MGLVAPDTSGLPEDHERACEGVAGVAASRTSRTQVQPLMLSCVWCRRDPCLQRNLQGDSPDNSMLTMHTVLEVYRVADLSIVRVLPSADDEINTAAFHPFMVHSRLCSAASFISGGC